MRGGGCWLKASYTVEAALLLPLFLAVLMKGMLLGIECYEDVRAAAADVQQLSKLHPPEEIWRRLLVEGLAGK